MAKAKEKEAQKGGAVAKVEGGALVVESGQVPDYIRKDAARGNENVKTDDLVIPRLEIIQDLSPQVDEDSGEYIAGAKPGMLTNSVTNQLYGTEVMIVPVHYSKLWLVWTDRQKGGGFHGAYKTPEEAKARADQEGGEKAGIQIIDTPTHLCLLVNQHQNSVDEIIVSMPRTKAKVSRQWNSMVRMAGGDRFSRVYRLTTNKEKNKKGTFHNYVLAQSGFPAQRLYQMAEKLHASVAGGEKNFTMHTGGFNPGERDEGGANSEM